MEYTDFAKLFNIDGAQLLITKEYDSEDETYGLKQEVRIDGAAIAVTASYENDKDRDEYFESYSEKDGKAFLDSIENLMQ